MKSLNTKWNALQCVGSKLLGCFCWFVFPIPSWVNPVCYSSTYICCWLSFVVENRCHSCSFRIAGLWMIACSQRRSFSFLSHQAELKSKKAAESFALCIEKYNRVGGEFEQKMSESSQVSSSHHTSSHTRLQLSSPVTVFPVVLTPSSDKYAFVWVLKR